MANGRTYLTVSIEVADIVPESIVGSVDGVSDHVGAEADEGPGSPWSKGHIHAHALRIVGKELLRDMWLVRRAVEHPELSPVPVAPTTDAA